MCHHVRVDVYVVSVAMVHHECGHGVQCTRVHVHHECDHGVQCTRVHHECDHGVQCTRVHVHHECGHGVQCTRVHVHLAHIMTGKHRCEGYHVWAMRDETSYCISQ